MLTCRAHGARWLALVAGNVHGPSEELWGLQSVVSGAFQGVLCTSTFQGGACGMVCLRSLEVPSTSGGVHMTCGSGVVCLYAVVCLY